MDSKTHENYGEEFKAKALFDQPLHRSFDDWAGDHALVLEVGGSFEVWTESAGEVRFVSVHTTLDEAKEDARKIGRERNVNLGRPCFCHMVVEA